MWCVCACVHACTRISGIKKGVEQRSGREEKKWAGRGRAFSVVLRPGYVAQQESLCPRLSKKHWRFKLLNDINLNFLLFTSFVFIFSLMNTHV